MINLTIDWGRIFSDIFFRSQVVVNLFLIPERSESNCWRHQVPNHLVNPDRSRGTPPSMVWTRQPKNWLWDARSHDHRLSKNFGQVRFGESEEDGAEDRCTLETPTASWSAGFVRVWNFHGEAGLKHDSFGLVRFPKQSCGIYLNMKLDSWASSKRPLLGGLRGIATYSKSIINRSDCCL